VSDARNAGALPVTARPTSVAGNRSRLMKACMQVEGLCLSRLMEAMDRPTFGEGMLGHSRATALFRARRNQALADEMGLRGQLGLAQMLHDDLIDHARQWRKAADSAAADSAAADHAAPEEGAEIR